MRSKPRMPAKQRTTIWTLVVFQLMACTFNPALAMDGREIVPSGSAGRHRSRVRHGRMGSSYGGITRDAIGYGDMMGGSSGISGMDEPHDTGTSQHGASSSRHDTPLPLPIDLAKFTGILQEMQQQCHDSINQCETKANALQSLAKNFQRILRASSRINQQQSESEIQDNMVTIDEMLGEVGKIIELTTNFKDLVMAGAGEWMDGIMHEIKLSMDLADGMSTLKDIQKQSASWNDLCQRNAKRLRSLAKDFKRILEASRGIIARQSESEIDSGMIIITGILYEASRKIVEWTVDAQDPVMTAANEWMGKTVDILEASMPPPQFKVVSEEIEQMFENVNEILDECDTSTAKSLTDIVAGLQGMWTTMQSKSGRALSLALDEFFQELNAVLRSIYKECGRESWKIQEALEFGHLGLKSHLSAYGSWEDPSECSKCGTFIGVGQREKLSCHHFVHPGCWRSRKPCARCVAEAGQNS
ncbi:hypothetical protein SeLEV6574_g04590 [Synchytrium endobioticum]|uniref:RING-type domain-containing protein n=1 Tax=Synchytrium endobioticum TaxID=286115 RepID=A0A507CYX9_9FUNG|nr:hypothetical protein SeLEV6574_g04590 [Synchytrium endobioticum]